MFTKTHSNREQKQQPTLCASDDYGTGFLHYSRFSRFWNLFSRQETAQLSTFFQCGVNRGPQNVVHSIAVSISFKKWFSAACKHAAHLTYDSLHVQDLLVRLKALLPECFWHVVCSDRIVTLHFILQHAPQVLEQIEIMASDLLHSLLICQTPKTLSQQCIDLFAVWTDRMSCWKKITWTVFQVY